MRDLRGANALLTGGSRGIGPYIARALAGEGVNVALSARNQGQLETVRDEIAGLGARAVAIAADLSQTEDRARLIETAGRELGPLDLLINNAGLEPSSEFARLAESTIEETIATNLTACAVLMRQVLPGMLERRRGHIVNIGSVAGKVAIPYDSIYSATKFGLVALSHAVREELRGTGVGVSVVCPGFVSEAGMYADMGVPAPAIAGTSRPEQVAAAVLRAIQRDVAEVIVTPLSGRPLITAAGLSPAAGMALMRRVGVLDLFRKAAENKAERGPQP